MKILLLLTLLLSSAACGANPESKSSIEFALDGSPSERILLQAAFDWENDFGKLSKTCKRDLNKIKILEFNSEYEVAIFCDHDKPLVGCMLSGYRQKGENEYHIFATTNNSKQQKRYSIYNSFACWAAYCHGDYPKKLHKEWARYKSNR